MKSYLAFLSSLLWPVVALTVVYVFHKEIKGFLRGIKTFKFKEIEFEIKEKIEAANLVADKIDTLENTQVDVTNADVEDVQRSKIAHIMNKWIEVENEVKARWKLAFPSSPWSGALSAFHEFNKASLIGEAELGLFNKLYEIRNIAAHDAESYYIGEGLALEFSRISNILLARLQNLREAPRRAANLG